MASSNSPVSGSTSAANSASKPGVSNGVTVVMNGPDTRVLTRRQLQDLVKQVDPNTQLDEDVEDHLLSYGEMYMQDLIEGACELAAHRKSSTIEAKDAQMFLERNRNIWLPGFGTDELRPYKRAPVTEAHKQRMALIKKTLKKY